MDIGLLVAVTLLPTVTVKVYHKVFIYVSTQLGFVKSRFVSESLKSFLLKSIWSCFPHRRGDVIVSTPNTRGAIYVFCESLEFDEESGDVSALFD